MDTVLLSDEPAEKGWRKKKKLRFSEEDAAFEGELSENESGRYAMKTPSERRSGVFLTVEFALAARFAVRFSSRTCLCPKAPSTPFSGA